MKKILLTVILFFIMCMPVLASTWVKTGAYTYIDKDSIRVYVNDSGIQDNTKKVYWYKVLNDGSSGFKQLEAIDKKEVKHVLYQNIIDNSRNSTAIKSGIIYGKDGSPIDSYTNKDYELNWNSIVPETQGEYEADLVNNPELLEKIYKKQQQDKSK